MKEFVARENIKRFEAQLAACADPQQRETLSRLLEAERQQLRNVRVETMNLPPTGRKASH